MATGMKGTLFFTQLGQGWSETVYYDDVSLAAGIERMTDLATRRQKLLATGATIIGLRVAQVNPAGFATSRRLSASGSSGLVATQPYQSLQVSLIATSSARRQYLMRGLPDARTTLGQYVGSQEYDTALQQYFGRMLSDENPVNLQTILRSHPLRPLVTIEENGTMILAQPAPEIELGNEVRLFRTRDNQGRNVSFSFAVATKSSDTLFTLAGWPAGRIVARGQVRKLEHVYRRVVAWDNTERVWSRKVGRPFGLRPGRQSHSRARPT